MNRLAWISSAIIVVSSLSSVGCGLFRRRSNVNTSVSSSVQVAQTGRDVATLERDEYEVIETSIGRNKSTSVYVLTFPVGSQTTHEEQVDSAYFAAVDHVVECDAMLMPRVDTKRVVIPLLLVNIMVRRISVKGRCIHIKDDDALAGIEADDDEATSDSGAAAEETATPEAAGGEDAAG